MHRDEGIDRQDLACKNSPELIDLMSGDCRPVKALLEAAHLQEAASANPARVSGTVYPKGIVIAPHLVLKRPQRAKAVHRDGADALDLGSLLGQRRLQREHLVAHLAEEVELDREPAKVQGRFAVGLDFGDEPLDEARDGDDVAYTILRGIVVNRVAVQCTCASQVIFMWPERRNIPVSKRHRGQVEEVEEVDGNSYR